MELLIVFAIISIMVGISLFALRPAQRAYRTDDAASQVMRFMREANSLALSQRKTRRLTIDNTAKFIAISDENGTPSNTADDIVLMKEPLFDPAVKIGVPTGFAATPGTKPPSPYDFSTATFASTGNAIWYCRFKSDGTVRNAASPDVPQSAVLYFFAPTTPTATTAADPTLVRAVSIFGPGGSVKSWRYVDSTTGFVGR